MYRSLFAGDLLAELERLQRSAQRFTGPATSIRGYDRLGFPALNVAGTPEAVEVYAFAPGLDPQSIAVTVERGVLSISGERAATLPTPPAGQGSQPGRPAQAGATVHINERFSGRFQRAISLSDDADPDQVSATYTNGVLHVSVKRRASAQPRRIEVH